MSGQFILCSFSEKVTYQSCRLQWIHSVSRPSLFFCPRSRDAFKVQVVPILTSMRYMPSEVLLYAYEVINGKVRILSLIGSTRPQGRGGLWRQISTTQVGWHCNFSADEVTTALLVALQTRRLPRSFENLLDTSSSTRTMTHSRSNN